MLPAIQNDAYTPAQVAAITGLSLPAVHKAIEYKLIRPKRVREGRSIQRLLSRSQAVYLRMEARGLRSLPLAERRQVAREIERNPNVDAFSISNGGVILIECKSARKEVADGLRRLAAVAEHCHSAGSHLRNARCMPSTP